MEIQGDIGRYRVTTCSASGESALACIANHLLMTRFSLLALARA